MPVRLVTAPRIDSTPTTAVALSSEVVDGCEINSTPSKHKNFIAVELPHEIVIPTDTLRAPPLSCIRLGAVCTTKQPVCLEQWLAHHANRCGVIRFYILVESTPELSELLERKPWSTMVEVTWTTQTQASWEAMQVRQTHHVQHAIAQALADGLTHLVHLDDDELLFAPSGWASLHEHLGAMSDAQCEAHALTLEALAPHHECEEPFREVRCFRHDRRRYTGYGAHVGSAGKSIGKLIGGMTPLEPCGPHHFRRSGPTVSGEPPVAADKGDFQHTLLLPPTIGVVLHFDSVLYERWRRKFCAFALLALTSGREQHFDSGFYQASLHACVEYERALEAGADDSVLEAAEAAMRSLWASAKLEPPALQEACATQEEHRMGVMQEHGVTWIPPSRRGAVSAIDKARKADKVERPGTARPPARGTQRKRIGARVATEATEAPVATTHVHPKSDAVSRRMLATFARKAPFEGHEEIELSQIVAAMAPVDVSVGADVINEGEHGDLAYWLEEGELSVHVGDKEVDTIVKDTVFGEVALVYDLPRTATIRAKGACKIWTLHRANFRHILRDNAISERKSKFGFLKTVKIFNSLSGREISRVADVIEYVSFEAEAAIITEGEDADAMYIIQDGQAVVSQALDQVPEGEDADADAAKSLLRILKPGDYFGERALLEDQKRSASVTAASKVSVLRIDKATFRDLLGGLREELIKRAPSDRRRTEKRPSVEVGASVASIPLANYAGTSPLPAELQPSKPLGSGGYGRVRLVRDKKTRRVYALKRVCKAHLLARNGAKRCEWLSREKRLLDELEHPFIVSLHGTYGDDDAIYLLLGAAMGGDLYRLINKLNIVPEGIARFYISSLVLALAHIHAHEIVYRDLKPENVLLDSQGYVKLCDFGFAKKVTDRTYTRCGTPDYTTPEMLLNQGVNHASDWWSLGVVAFEMLVGSPPFTDPDGDDMKTYQNIVRGKTNTCYPPDASVTDEARTLINGLCTVKVAYRLGYLKGGANDVMAQPWFVGVDWDGLINLTKAPPWQPTSVLKGFDDTQCFDAESQGASLEGETTDVHSVDLIKLWTELQGEYTRTPGKLDSMGHLT